MAGGGDVAVRTGVPGAVDTEVSNSVTLKACMAIQRMVMGEGADEGSGRRGGSLASSKGFLKLRGLIECHRPVQQRLRWGTQHKWGSEENQWGRELVWGWWSI